MIFLKKHFKLIAILAIFVGSIFLGSAVWRETPNHILTVAFLNIGQGDSIYIESPTHRKFIIDGGPNTSMLSEIGKIMPWYDHSIDGIMITNPDVDHYGGFIDLLKRYSVGFVLEPGTVGGSSDYRTLEDLIVEKHVKKVVARRGQSVDLGGGVFLKILFPDRDVSKLKTNDGSIVAELIYGSTTVMFTGDAPNSTEEYVLSLDGKNLKSNILKAGHHGSKTSASEPFVYAVAPEYGVISAGLNNRYGHPNKETLDLFDKLKIKTLITFKSGTIIFKSDGKTFVRD